MLTGRFNDMINELKFQKTTSQLTKPMFGYHRVAAKPESDRVAALKNIDGFMGMNSSKNLMQDKEHVKSEA